MHAWLRKQVQEKAFAVTSLQELRDSEGRLGGVKVTHVYNVVKVSDVLALLAEWKKEFEGYKQESEELECVTEEQKGHHA